MINKAKKSDIVEKLSVRISKNPYMYITDASDLSVAHVNRLRARCHAEEIGYVVVKNTLIKKALEKQESEVYQTLSAEAFRGFSGLFFNATRAASTAKLLLSFHQEESLTRPHIKAAILDGDVYMSSPTLLQSLSQLKSKEELLADIVAMLSGSLHRLVGALGGGQLPALLLALEKAPKKRSSNEITETKKTVDKEDEKKGDVEREDSK